jgi:hypothetical protein
MPALVAAQIASTPQPFVEQQLQQERERALREQNMRHADVRTHAASAAPNALIASTPWTSNGHLNITRL